MKKNRSALKLGFQRGNIPTEADFVDLIDSMLNQEDDQISKPDGSSALKVLAAGVEQGLLDLYRGATLCWKIGQKPSANPGLNISEMVNNSATSRLFVETGSGNVGIGSTTPIAKLDIALESRVGTHPAAVKGLYITGAFDWDRDGVEFRHFNGTQGIGIAYSTIYATGSNANQDLNFKARGAGQVTTWGAKQVNGTLRVSGATTLDGNVGIGTATPAAKLDVSGDAKVSGKATTGTLQVSGTGASSFTGNVGIGTTTPIAKLDIALEPRSGTHPAAVKGLYITGGFDWDRDGVEFRHTNGTQGIGIAYSTIYATGSNDTQHLNLKPRGAGQVIAQGTLRVAGTAIMDGRVGIGTAAPTAALEVNGAIVEKFPVVACGGRTDFGSATHPLQLHFKAQLLGKAPGTMIRALSDHIDWKMLYWEAWINIESKIVMTYPGGVNGGAIIIA